jgi:hypothetical protein
MPEDAPLIISPPAPDTLQRDLAIMKMDVEALHVWLSRIPTRGDLARAVLGIIFCTAVATTFLGWWFRQTKPIHRLVVVSHGASQPSSAAQLIQCGSHDAANLLCILTGHGNLSSRHRGRRILPHHAVCSAKAVKPMPTRRHPASTGGGLGSPFCRHSVSARGRQVAERWRSSARQRHDTITDWASARRLRQRREWDRRVASSRAAGQRCVWPGGRRSARGRRRDRSAD